MLVHIPHLVDMCMIVRLYNTRSPSTTLKIHLLSSKIIKPYCIFVYILHALAVHQIIKLTLKRILNRMISFVETLDVGIIDRLRQFCNIIKKMLNFILFSYRFILNADTQVAHEIQQRRI